MAATSPLMARFSVPHNLSLAVVSLGMIGVVVGYFMIHPANAPTLSLNDQRFVLIFLLAIALGYYVLQGVGRARNREPQIVIDKDGIQLGFGRNRRFAWDDIDWVRLRRLGFRPQLEIGLGGEAFMAANLRLSLWGLDDSLRPVRGQPTTVLVRDNGLDTRASAMLDAVRSFRPNLVRS